MFDEMTTFDFIIYFIIGGGAFFIVGMLIKLLFKLLFKH